MNSKSGTSMESSVSGSLITPSKSLSASDSRHHTNYYINNSVKPPSNNNNNHLSKYHFDNESNSTFSTPPTVKANYKLFNGNSGDRDGGSENDNLRGVHRNHIKIVPQLTFSPDTPPALPLVPPPPLDSSMSTTPFFSSNGHTHSRNSSSANNSLIDIDTDQLVASSSIVNHNHSHSSSNSTEENFECFGEGTESFLDSTSENTSLQYTRDVSDLGVSDSTGGGINSHPSISRNSWQRTSLRKSPQNNTNGESMGHRRWGSFRNTPGTKRTAVTSSNALANQLYRSSSFHSSGRSSAGDGEEMYSDGSLEDEVIDLTQKVHHLEEKFTVLAENQNDVDDRYTRAKQENAELSTKLFMLEEQLRDVEMRAEEKLREEQRRFKESYTRLEREKQLQIENYDIRFQNLEKDLGVAKTEANRFKVQLERERGDKNHLTDKLQEADKELMNLRDQNKTLVEQSRKDRDAQAVESAGSQQALLDLKKEFESLRRYQMENSTSALRRHESTDSECGELKSRLREYEEEVKRLKKQNQQLQETNDELSAQILNHGLEEGRHLLTLNSTVPMGNSLAAEFEAMSQEQMQTALKEQKEVNDQLRNYIDGILLTIVENYPQLLEVKNKGGDSSGTNSGCMSMTEN